MILVSVMLMVPFVQFKYGEDGVDVHRTSFLKNFRALVDNQETLRQKFQCEREFNAYIDKLPGGLEVDAGEFFKNLIDSESEEFWKISKSSKTVNRADFLKLVNQKYLSSLAPSGEPVGVIAAQSIGEPSTQMTLNTFHLAGRGEMNVTLGIPHLQEILMTASDVIKTPVLTCPFLHLKSKNAAKTLLAKIKKITVADIIESMEVHLLPPSVLEHRVSRIYKLLITFIDHGSFSQKDFKETLNFEFLRGLEDAIQKHVDLLWKIGGIRNVMSSGTSKEVETDEDPSGFTSDGGKKDKDTDDDGDDDGDDESTEDLGLDMQKRKHQTTDEMEYEDGSEDDSDQEESPAEVKKGNANQSHDERRTTADDALEDADNEDDAPEMHYENEEMTEPKSTDKWTKPRAKKKKSNREFKRKDGDRHVFAKVKGLIYEVHFKFGSEPHLLLDQIAQKVAKKVHIKGSGKIRECSMVEYDPTEKTVRWDEKRTKEHADRKRRPVDDMEQLRYWALKAAGVDFEAFWEMADDLDVTRIYSNNIHTVLKTYGVEAARRTIITEVTNVFEAYGVKVDYRHLSLIADYMTHTGGYRAMSRHGSIAESLSPLAKMPFETASKFIVEAASHEMSENLETPSARISLGLPVKMGTGSFDLMQKLEID